MDKIPPETNPEGEQLVPLEKQPVVEDSLKQLDSPASSGKQPDTTNTTTTNSPCSESQLQPMNSSSPESSSQQQSTPPPAPPAASRSAEPPIIITISRSPNRTSRATTMANSNEDQDTMTNNDDNLSSTLGRNKRVRQKNRYFSDFHCIDLTKGGRSREDLSYSQSAATIRTSKRRATADSSQQADEPEVFETKYCRKCSYKTAHDFDGGCQVCLYNKIVSSTKRQRPSGSQRSRSHSKQQSSKQQQQHHTHQQQSQPQQLEQNQSQEQQQQQQQQILEQQQSPPLNQPSQRQQEQQQLQQQSENQEQKPSSIPTRNAKLESTEIDQLSSDTKARNGFSNDLHWLDAWTPDDVANYILSHGFVNEAESFLSQSVDGLSLLLMQRNDFTSGLKLKLGPALKIYDQVCKLKREYFGKITTSAS